MKRLQFDNRPYSIGASLGLALIGLAGCGPQPAESGSSAANRATNSATGAGENPNATLAVASSSTASLPEAQGYRIGTDPSTAENGPVRMAKFSLISGPVEWRATTSGGWSKASINLPLRQGADIWTNNGGRSEVQFDDGSNMRLASGAVAQLTTMYSDSKGEFTEIKLNNGVATFHLVNKDSLYQIDTPDASIKAYGPALIRVGDTSGLEVADRAGQVEIEGKPGKITLASDQYINYPPNATTAQVERAPAQDSWDKFNDNRDALVYQKHENMPDNVALMAGDMNSYGSWHNDPQYGEMWAPREAADWEPYHNGRWVWCDPYGWTWVGNEPWGWTPYHYGTWSHRPWGWGWRPGPDRQYWSPAVVQFSEYNNNVAWCALDPSEVRYPSELSVGIGSGNWFLSFGIGATACYYPGGGGYCEPHPWRNDWVNGGGYGYNVTNINNYYGNDRGLASSWRGGSGWIPRNARYGSSYVSERSFGNGTERYHHLDGSRAAFFSKGQSFHSPQNGAGPISGPFNVHPNSGSFTTSRHFMGAHPSEAILNRSVYHAPTPSLIAQHSTGQRSFAGNAAQRAGGGNAFASRNAGNRVAQANSSRPGAANRYDRFNNVSHGQNGHVAGPARAAIEHASPKRDFGNHVAQARVNTQANHRANVVRRQANSVTRTHQAMAQRNRTTQVRRSTQTATHQSNRGRANATRQVNAQRSTHAQARRAPSSSGQHSAPNVSRQNRGGGSFQHRGGGGNPSHQNRGGGGSFQQRGGGSRPQGHGGGPQRGGGKPHGGGQAHGGGQPRGGGGQSKGRDGNQPEHR